ncbi:hypothetical protein [Paenibacillus sp. KN14-4R]|uniref:hypothetical protein n=1 Tax=Paenibacillus sp. KN14-4R TaxID=3445773 RepID=UPI003FA141B6
MWYKLFLYIHIISAITSIGPFFILLPMLAKLRTAELAARNAYLDTFRSANRLAKHMGHVLVASGIGLVLIGHWSWSTSWIVITLALLVGSSLFLVRAFSPKLRKFNEPDLDVEKVVQALRRATWTYLILLLVMLWFMVTKPELW